MKVKLLRLNIGRKIVSMLRFADDIIMIAESEGGIEHAKDKTNETLRSSEMKTSSAKTKVLVGARGLLIKADVYIGNLKLDRVYEMA